VSRVGYLDRILDSLTKQTYKPDALIAILDLYTDEEYLEARNKIVGLPLKHVVCGIEMEIPATDTSQVVTLTLMGTIWRQTKYPSGQAP
jgi:hypothetical protein